MAFNGGEQILPDDGLYPFRHPHIRQCLFIVIKLMGLPKFQQLKGK